ncbi:hypothetical protein [Streptomyces sp. IB2014 016-6]|uniref:hypothetical protein n=1 Tax=Streptomyces sp. IB2014 016-6 TaxID=2517818 RepID=UPI0011CBC1E0|nr:hypothetical protein [Streptomyces sp. IB2014 016-6]TXL85650.1 hypothetical protein EW053_29670 [Streptomyces sp. IB2014 016-6]
MKSTREPAAAHGIDAEVTVELSGCETEDAHAVFGALRTVFASDRAPDDRPQEVTGARPTVWSSTFDVSEVRRKAGPTRLSRPVTADVQGGYWAVAKLQEELTGAFAVQVLGTAAGDQEQEVQLRLDTRHR